MLQYSCLWSIQDSLNESPPGVAAIIILEELFLKIMRMKSRIKGSGYASNETSQMFGCARANLLCGNSACAGAYVSEKEKRKYM